MSIRSTLQQYLRLSLTQFLPVCVILVWMCVFCHRVPCGFSTSFLDCDLWTEPCLAFSFLIAFSVFLKKTVLMTFHWCRDMLIAGVLILWFTIIVVCYCDITLIYLTTRSWMSSKQQKQVSFLALSSGLNYKYLFLCSFQIVWVDEF